MTTICLPVRSQPSWVHMAVLMAWLRTLLSRSSIPAASTSAEAQRHRHAATLLKRRAQGPGAVNRSGLRDLCDGRDGVNPTIMSQRAIRRKNRQVKGKRTAPTPQLTARWTVSTIQARLVLSSVSSVWSPNLRADAVFMSACRYT